MNSITIIWKKSDGERLVSWEQSELSAKDAQRFMQVLVLKIQELVADQKGVEG